MEWNEWNENEWVNENEWIRRIREGSEICVIKNSYVSPLLVKDPKKDPKDPES